MAANRALRPFAAVCAAAAALALAPAVAPQTSATGVRAGGVSVQPAMRPWRYGGANPDGWWCPAGACLGVTSGADLVRRELPLIARLGASLVRVEFPWPLIEPARGRYAWARADLVVRLAARHRLRLVPVLVYSPSWAARAEADPPPARAFARFARAVARRYGRVVDHYELWNEPDLERYWTGGVADYVQRVLVPGSRAIRAADRRALIVIGGPADADVAWLDGVYAAGGGAAFDVMAFHDYSADVPSILRNARLIRDALARRRQARKPIWLGEFGAQEAGTDDRLHQALISGVLRGSSPLAAAFWYTLRDDRVLTCCPPAVLKTETYGVLTERYEPKASHATLRAELARLRQR